MLSSIPRSLQALLLSGDRQLDIHIWNRSECLPDGLFYHAFYLSCIPNLNTASRFPDSVVSCLRIMDLRSILNFDERPKVSTGSSQSSRKTTRPAQGRSTKGKSPLRTITTSIKVETTWPGPLTPKHSPRDSIYSTEVPWTQNQSPIEGTMRHSVGDGRGFSGNRPKTSTSSTAKRRASAYSPVSHSSSACSSPSPATPSSMTSTGTRFHPSSSSKGGQYQRRLSSNVPRLDPSENSLGYHVVGKD